MLHILRTGAAAAALLLATAAPCASPSEAEVKAAFLAKFVAYVNWPASLRLPPDAALTLCVLGNDPFGRTIDETVRGQQVNGHSLAVKRLAGTQGAAGCQLAFVEGTSPHSTNEFLAAMQGKPILTVTDARNGPQRGIIHFVVADGRVRFLIDQAAAERDGLELSARLLAVALDVRADR